MYHLRKILLLQVFIFYSYCFAGNCKVDDIIMYSLAEIESDPHRAIGYPYIISINKKSDIEKVKISYPVLKELFISRRTLDCNNKEQCIVIYNALEDINVTNIDCGGFQINRKFWGDKPEIFFDAEKSYHYACSIVMEKNTNGWSWKNIAKYHSNTPKYNKIYRERLLKTIKKNIHLFKKEGLF